LSSDDSCSEDGDEKQAPARGEPRTEVRRNLHARRVNTAASSPPNHTGAALRSAVESVRRDCQMAGLVVERFQRASDEYWRDIDRAGVGEDSYDLCVDYLPLFQEALKELGMVGIEDPPAAAGFADCTILAEVSAARRSLAQATGRCRAAVSRIADNLARAHADDEDGTRDGAQAGALGVAGGADCASGADGAGGAGAAGVTSDRDASPVLQLAALLDGATMGEMQIDPPAAGGTVLPPEMALD